MIIEDLSQSGTLSCHLYISYAVDLYLLSRSLIRVEVEFLIILRIVVMGLH